MLVNCVAYQDGRKIAELAVDQLDEISEYLARPGCFVWVALKDPDAAELERMSAEFELHPLAVEDAMRGHQRPKIEEYDEGLFVVLKTVELDRTALHIGEVDIFVGKNYVLSVRHHTKLGFASVRERTEREPELLAVGPAYILYVLMDTVVDRYFPIVDELELELERIEDRIFSKGASARLNIEEVYELKQKLMVLQHSALPLLEAVGKLYGGRVPQICASMQDYFRDVSDHVLRISKSIEILREMSTTAIQVNLSLISLGESEVTKKLASWGALFAVPTAIAGIYGMNFKHMPELDHPWGYPVVLAAIIVVDFVLWMRFKRAGWV